MSRGCSAFRLQEFGRGGAGLFPQLGPVSLPPGIHRPGSAMQGRARTMVEGGMSPAERGPEDEDDETAGGPAVIERSSAAPSTQSTAQVPTGPPMPRNPMRSEEAALLRECFIIWSYVGRFVAHQEYRVSYERLAMERSRQLTELERTHRIVGWAGLFGAGGRQRPLGREARRVTE